MRREQKRFLFAFFCVIAAKLLQSLPQEQKKISIRVFSRNSRAVILLLEIEKARHFCQAFLGYVSKTISSAQRLISSERLSFSEQLSSEQLSSSERLSSLPVSLLPVSQLQLSSEQLSLLPVSQLLLFSLPVFQQPVSQQRVFSLPVFSLLLVFFAVAIVCFSRD